MGRRKTNLRLWRGGRSVTVLEWAVLRLRSCTTGCVIPVRMPSGAAFSLPSIAAIPGLATVTDRRNIPGPLGGVLAAVAVARERGILVLAADLPNVPRSLLGRLVAEASLGADWVAPGRPGRAQPLCAYYGPAACAALEQQAAEGHFGLQSLFRRRTLEGRWIAQAEFGRFGQAERLMLNLNTPEDLRRWRALEALR